MDESSAVVWMLRYEGQGRQGPRQYARPCKASQYEWDTGKAYHVFILNFSTPGYVLAWWLCE